jgi:Tfp pilus assembly protein PilF
LVTGSHAFHTFQMNAKSGRIEVQVLICIEAISSKPLKEKHSLPRLITVTAFTPKSEPFHDEGKRALLSGKCSIFANVAEFGASRMFARADNTSLWFTEKDGSKSIPRGSEALLVMEADLERQFEIRQLVTARTAVTDMRVYPILYPMLSSEAEQFVDVVRSCSSVTPTLAKIAAQVSPFITLTTRVFPQLLQEKLSHYIGHIAPAGILSSKEAIKWITPLIIRDAKSTDALRWELCNESIDTVNGLLVSGKYVHKTDELSKVYLHLISSRNELAGSFQVTSEATVRTDQLKAPARAARAESPFIDRDSAFDKIRQFFGQQQNSVLILGGMRGIGKTQLVEEAFRQAIPLRKRIWLQLTEGISYQRLLAELAYECNLQLPENLKLTNAATEEDVKRRILSYLGQGPGTVVVIDDFQYLLNASAEIDDPGLRDLLLGLAEAGQRGRTKYFFISHVFPRLGPQFENHFMSYTLHGLQAPDTRRLLLHWRQFDTDNLAGGLPEPAERLISILGGHPLATKMAARLWAEHPTADIAEDFAIFQDLRDTIVGFILEKLTLATPERELLSFASIFRLPAPREVFLKWRSEDASYLLSSLAGHYLIESSERGYQLHPLVRSFFGNSTTLAQTKEWHKTAGKFYLQEFERLKSSSKQIVPEYLGEAVHHFLAAGERQKVQDFAFYSQELRPVALDHFRSGEQKVAMKDYQVLLELDKNDTDAHFHLSLIFANLKRWSEAELHFGKAISLRPKAPWILQGFGAAMIRGGKVAQGEDLLLQSERANPKHSPTLVELGRLRDRQHKPEEAEQYLLRAIEVDSNNAYAYYCLARLLYREGDIQEAYKMATAALLCNPVNPRNKSLVQELKSKIADVAGTAKSSKITAVQIKCVERTKETSAHNCIQSIGGVNSDGKKWNTSISKAISYIEEGKFTFFIKTPDGRPVDIVVAQDILGHKYLRTRNDTEQPIGLLNMPFCP